MKRADMLCMTFNNSKMNSYNVLGSYFLKGISRAEDGLLQVRDLGGNNTWKTGIYRQLIPDRDGPLIQAVRRIPET
jgi:hypothetical protein